jgi:hypothetical protein
MDGERTIAAKTRPRERTATEVAVAAEMHTAAEMPAAMPAEMPTAVAAPMKMAPASVTTTMATSTVAPAAMAATAAFRSGIASGRQRGRKNKDGNSNLEF